MSRSASATPGSLGPQIALTPAEESLWESISWLPNADRVYDLLLQRLMGGSGGTVRTGAWYSVLPHIRQVRFREMEYTVPAEAGPACVREILRTIRERKLPDCFPLEYRHTAGDDVWLSMFEGRPGASISVHQFGDTDYRPYFAEIEPIFWKYQGRPHWGKLHTLMRRGWRRSTHDTGRTSAMCAARSIPRVGC